MSWILRAARTGAVAIVAVALGLLAGMLRSANAPVPSLTQGALAPVPVVAVLALLPAVAATWMWLQIPRAASAVSVRRGGWHQLLLLSAPVAYALSSAIAGGSGALAENARNALGLLGLALIGMRALGERGGVLLPVAYLLASFLAGRGVANPSPHAWAWVLRDGGDATAGLLATVLAVVGLLAAVDLPRSLVRRGEF